MKKALAVGVVMVGSALGCARGGEPVTPSLDGRFEAPDRESPSQLFSGSGFVTALGGRLDGSIGPAVGLAGDAEYVNFYDDGYTSSADMVVRGPNGTGMGIIWLTGSVQDMEVGSSVRTCQDDYSDPNSAVNTGGVAANFTGCANDGAPEDGWDYDAPAECTDVVIVEAAPEAPANAVATLSIMAHWGAEMGGGQERTVKATIHLTE